MMGIRLLGTLEIIGAAGESIEIGGTAPRVILAMLVAADGKVVPVDGLIDAVWDESPPASASGTLQTYVSRLRRALDEIGGTIVRAPAGYRLEIERDAVDVHRFETLAGEGRTLLEAGDAAAACAVLVEAEQLWRGPALIEVRDRARVAGIARRLDDRRLAALEDRITAELALGRHTTLVAELAQHVGEHPLREGLWELLALARYRSGMQAEALRAISQARDTLVEALGVDPGPGLRQLEQAILDHDPALDAPAVVEPAPVSHDGTSNPHPGTLPEESSAPKRLALIGRDRELAVLTSALDQAAHGGACIAVVQGEAGVGKTRLVEELASEATARGGRAVWGRALEGGAAPAYWPWLGVLRTLRMERPDRSSDAIDRLLDASATMPTVPDTTDHSRLLDGVLGLLEPVADRGPLVVILEDVQWADAESLELITQVTSGFASGDVLLVLTARDGQDACRPAVVKLLAAVSRRDGTRRLHLGGLEVEATATLLASVCGRDVDAALARVVHDRADGNPFYAIELQRLLGHDDRVDAASVAATAVPVGVRDVVRQRLGKLSESALELLRLAAVAGRDIDIALVSAASGRSFDACLDVLEEALEHRLLADAGVRGGLRFAHALVREVLVDELSSLRRARLHLAIADAIDAMGRDHDQAEILAEHLWAATPIGVDRRAAEALDRAAAVAIGRFAMGTACDLLERSLELRRTGRGTERADAAAELETLLRLVWALRARGGYQGGLDHYERAAELAHRLGRDDVELEMQWAQWAGLCTSCQFDQARPIAQRFRDRAMASDDGLAKFTGLTVWAIQSWHEGDLSESAATFELAAAVRSAVVVDADDVSFVGELVALTTVFGLYVDVETGRVDDPDAAFTALGESFSGNLHTAMVWSFAASSAAGAGDLERLERCARRVLDAEGGETLGFFGSQGRMYLGAVLIATGQVDEGRELFESARQAYARAGMRTGAALMQAAVVSAEVAAGDLDCARRHLTLAQDELLAGEGWPAPYVLLAAAEVAEASGASVAEVLDIRERAEELALSQGAVAAATRARAAISGPRRLPPTRELQGAGAH